MEDLSVDAVKAEIARIRRESDEHHLLGSDLDQMRRTLNAAMERMRIAEAKTDDLECDRENAEQRAKNFSRCLGIARGFLQVIANGHPDKWEAAELARDGLLESAPIFELEANDKADD